MSIRQNYIKNVQTTLYVGNKLINIHQVEYAQKKQQDSHQIVYQTGLEISTVVESEANYEVCCLYIWRVLSLADCICFNLLFSKNDALVDVRDSIEKQTHHHRTLTNETQTQNKIQTKRK